MKDHAGASPGASSLRRHWRQWGTVAGATTIAMAAALVAGPMVTAGAATTLTQVTQGATGTVPTAGGGGVPEGTAQITTIASAVNPTTGDVAEVTNIHQVFLVVNEANEPATDYGIGTTGTLTQGDVYLVAGDGGSGWTSQTSTTFTSAAPLAASANLIGAPQQVAFDGSGNLLIASNETGEMAVISVPVTSGHYYGFSATMQAGFPYFIAGFVPGVTLPVPAINFASVLTALSLTASSGLVAGGVQDVAFSTLTAVYLLNYSTAQSLYGATEGADTATKIVTGGGAACAAGAQSLAATTAAGFKVTKPIVYSDASGDLIVGNDSATNCTWELTKGSGTATKVAGDGTSAKATAPTNGAAAVSNSVSAVSGITEDLAGNIVLTMNGGIADVTTINGIYVVATSGGSYYTQTFVTGDLYLVAGGPGHGAFDEPIDVGAGTGGDLFLADLQTNVEFELSGAPTGKAVAAATTTTTLTASPTGTQTFGTAVVLTAHVTPTTAAGKVAFFSGAVKEGTSTVAGGVATITTSALPAGTDSLTAVFTPTNPAAFNTSTSSALSYSVVTESSLTTGAATIHTPTAQGFTITVTVAPTGSFELTFKGATKLVHLSAPKYLTKSGHATHAEFSSHGTISNWELTTTVNTVPGWTVTGKVGNFVNAANAAYTIPAVDLGWTPAATDATTASGVTAGPATTPGVASPSLGAPAGSLWAAALATHGHGTTALSAALLLIFPASTHPGVYNAPFTVTAIQN